MVSFTGDIGAIEPHSRGAGFNFAVVVGAVADANQVHHLLSDLHLPIFIKIKSSGACLAILLKLHCRYFTI